ncbi:MAG: GntR family transcriptional regulator [Bacillota bacterium]
MWLNINPSLGMPIYLQIMDQIRHAVAGGYLSPGEKLPSVRDLALELTVSPNTVVRAYRELEREGLVTTRQGSGTFITEKRQQYSPERQYRTLEPLLRHLMARARLLGVSQRELVEMVKRCHGMENADETECSKD